MTSVHTLVGPDGRKPQLASFMKTIVDAPFGGAAMPTGLEASAGTPTFSTIATTHGYTTLTTAATTNAEATLRTVDSYLIQNWATLWARFEGVRLETTNPLNLNFSVGFRGTSNAFMLSQTSTDLKANTLRYGGTAQEVNWDIRNGSNRGKKHHSITVGIDRERKQGLWKIGDGQVQVVDIPALVDYSVRPQLSITTKEAVAHWFRCSNVRVWGEYN